MTEPTVQRRSGLLPVAGGYVAATVTASFVVSVILGLWAGTYEDFPRFFFMGCVYTFVCALPGFIATIAIAHRLNIRAWLFFTVAGGLDGILSLMFFDRSLLYDTFVSFVVAGGLAGGFVYWLAVFRFRSTAT